MSISAGRDLTEADCKSRARVCVIGETLRKYFFGAMSPIGQELRIGGKSFEIVGVYAGKYGGKLNTNDQMLIMPYTLQSLMMSSQGMSDHQYIIKAENHRTDAPGVHAAALRGKRRLFQRLLEQSVSAAAGGL